ncbi:hypothetical protein M2318_000207 [Metapseudomonas resinovorans]
MSLASRDLFQWAISPISLHLSEYHGPPGR